ncbi:MAG: SMP-30/gluconolactonase/LRE family protein [Pseudomonadota bacterium]
MQAEIYDDRRCELGEGPLWHPRRKQLFWFDILGKRMLSRRGDVVQSWEFDRYVSAASWADHDVLVLATETDICQLDLTTDQMTRIAPLDADSPNTRSNDARADPYGGFWIGTMGKSAELNHGAIHRYYRGEIRKLIAPLTIPNAISFAPDGSVAYYADTAVGKVWRQPLDRHGWPKGSADVFIDHGPDGGPDGAVVDGQGMLWNAHWGHFKVSVYDQAGNLMRDLRLPARQPSCPAFGGPGLNRLFVTTAREHLGDDASDHDGVTYAFDTDVRGQEEHQVIL